MSHLKHFGVGNFKVFKEMTQFELAPITILTGKNNSGKSSLIKSLQLFRNRDELINIRLREHFIENLTFDRPELKLGSPQEIFNFNLDRDVITFEFSINSPMLPNGLLTLEYELINSNESFAINSIKIANDGESIVEYKPNLNSERYFDIIRNHYIKIDFQYFINRLKELISDVTTIDQSIVGVKIGLYKNKYDSLKYNPSDVQIEKILEVLQPEFILLAFKNLSPPEEFVKEDYCHLIGKNIEFQENELIKIQNRLFEIFKEGFSSNKLMQIFGIINSFKGLNNLVSEKALEIFNDDESLLIKSNDQQLFAKGDLTVKMEPILHPFFNYLSIFIENLFYDFEKEFTYMTYLPSIRAKNERLYNVSKEGYAIQEIDQNTFDKIGLNDKNLLTLPIEIQQFYEFALKEFEIGDAIEIRTFQRSATEISIVRNGHKMLLSDLGFGYAQIIPIILNILITAKKYISWQFKEDDDLIPCPKMLIEEPESNLHPDFQSKLADLFVKASNLFGIQFIIETHSEYLIRRLQYLTARKDIKPEDISIYYFYNPDRIPEGEKQINRVQINSDGNLSQDFGSGFYDEAITWKFELLKLKNAQNN